MIANAGQGKGVSTFLKIAAQVPEYQFVLLTNKNTLMSKKARVNWNAIPSNARVVIDQSRKADLLARARFLISLSTRKETFGLVLTEAIRAGTIPLSTENMGSRFCLGRQDLFIQMRDPADAFRKTAAYALKNYTTILSDLQIRMNSLFSQECVLNQWKDLMPNE